LPGKKKVERVRGLSEGEEDLWKEDNRFTESIEKRPAEVKVETMYIWAEACFGVTSHENIEGEEARSARQGGNKRRRPLSCPSVLRHKSKQGRKTITSVVRFCGGRKDDIKKGGQQFIGWGGRENNKNLQPTRNQLSPIGDARETVSQPAQVSKGQEEKVSHNRYEKPRSEETSRRRPEENKPSRRLVTFT